MEHSHISIHIVTLLNKVSLMVVVITNVCLLVKSECLTDWSLWSKNIYILNKGSTIITSESTTTNIRSCRRQCKSTIAIINQITTTQTLNLIIISSSCCKMTYTTSFTINRSIRNKIFNTLTKECISMNLFVVVRNTKRTYKLRILQECLRNNILSI